MTNPHIYPFQVISETDISGSGTGCNITLGIPWVLNSYFSVRTQPLPGSGTCVNYSGLKTYLYNSNTKQFDISPFSNKNIYTQFNQPISTAVTSKNNIILVGGESNDQGKSGAAGYNLMQAHGGAAGRWVNDIPATNSDPLAMGGFNFSNSGTSSYISSCDITSGGTHACFLQIEGLCMKAPPWEPGDPGPDYNTKYNFYYIKSTLDNGQPEWDYTEEGPSGFVLNPFPGIQANIDKTLKQYRFGPTPQVVFGVFGVPVLNVELDSILITGIGIPTTEEGLDSELEIPGSLYYHIQNNFNVTRAAGRGAVSLYYSHFQDANDPERSTAKGSYPDSAIVSAKIIQGAYVVMANDYGQIGVWSIASAHPPVTPYHGSRQIQNKIKLNLPTGSPVPGEVRSFIINNYGTGYSEDDEIWMTPSGGEVEDDMFKIVVTKINSLGGVLDYYIKKRGTAASFLKIGIEQTTDTGGSGSGFSFTIRGIGSKYTLCVSGEDKTIYAVQRVIGNPDTTPVYAYGWTVQGDGDMWGHPDNPSSSHDLQFRRPDLTFKSPDSDALQGLTYNDYTEFGTDLAVSDGMLAVSMRNLKKGSEYNYSAIATYATY